MKNASNILGVIGFIIMLIGVIFKGMHYPGANLLMLLGTLLGVIFFFMSFLYKDINELNLFAIFSEYFLSFAMMISLVAFIFKSMHWPGGGVLVGISVITYFILGISISVSILINKEKQFISLHKITLAFLYQLTILIYFGMPLFYIPQ